MLNFIGRLMIVAGFTTSILLLAPEAPMASVANDTGGQVERASKSDRLPVFVKGADCSRHGWPNYEPKCLFDDRGSADDIRVVRVIALH
jgi:hypothetical protein